MREQKSKSVKIPKALYKYRPFDVYSLRLITEAETFYADPTSFNDPLDCKPSIIVDSPRREVEELFTLLARSEHRAGHARFLLREYAHLASEYGSVGRDEGATEYYLQILGSRIRGLLNRKLGKLGVLSLAGRWSCPLMWSHYADQHRGICIEYDLTDHYFERLRPITYGADRALPTSTLLSWLRENSAEGEERVRETYFYAKAGQWRYEKEWRDISDRPGVHQTPAKVGAVYFGLRCDDSILRIIANVLHKEPTVKLYQIYSADRGFGLKRYEIDVDELVQIPTRESAHFVFRDVSLE